MMLCVMQSRSLDRTQVKQMGVMNENHTLKGEVVITSSLLLSQTQTTLICSVNYLAAEASTVQMGNIEQYLCIVEDNCKIFRLLIIYSEKEKKIPGHNSHWRKFQ